MRRKERDQHRRWLAGLGLALLCLGAVGVSRCQLRLAGGWVSEPLKLGLPSPAVVPVELAQPSKLGQFAWSRGERLQLGFSYLRAGDLVKLKLAAEPFACRLAVELDDTEVARLAFPDGQFHEHRLLIPRDGQRLSLRRLQPACTFHFSRIKRQNFVATTGRALGEAYGVSRLAPLPSCAPWPAVALPALVALVASFVAGGRQHAPWLPAVSAGLLLAATLAGWLRGARLEYPAETLWLVWLAPPLGAWVAKALAWGVGGGRQLADRWRRWLSQLERLGRFLGRWASRPVAPRPVFLFLLAAYGLWLAATLPASPMEIDEVNFYLGVQRLDVVHHAPHPPGYPAYLALGKLMALLGLPAEKATALASAVGALVALFALAALLQQARLPALAVVSTGVAVACLPVFAFAANLGLSDMLATALALLALAAWYRLDEAPRPITAVLAGLGTALALAARPQVLLLLLLPVGFVVLALSRRRKWSWLWSLPTAALASALLWSPLVLATGFGQYLRASEKLARWMNTYEYLTRFPAMELSRYLEDWLLRPLASRTLALAFWLLLVVGGFRLLRAGKGRLVALVASGGLGYLLLAPWSMTAEAAVRYALPAHALLSALLAGLVLGRIRLLGAGLLGSYALAAFSWVLPALTLRAAEPNPLWAALTWVRQQQEPQVVWVTASVARHAQALLPPAGFRVQVVNRPLDRPGLWVVSPVPKDRQPLFSAAWAEPKLGLLARRRFLSAAAVRLPQASVALSVGR